MLKLSSRCLHADIQKEHDLLKIVLLQRVDEWVLPTLELAHEVRYISGGVAHLSSPPKAPKHFFREMGIGSVDVCYILCLEVVLRFSVLCCDRAAVFHGGRVRHSTCVVLWYSNVAGGLTQQCVSCFVIACVPCFDHSSVSIGLTQHLSRALTQQYVPCFDTVAFVVLVHSRIVSCLTQQQCIVFWGVRERCAGFSGDGPPASQGTTKWHIFPEELPPPPCKAKATMNCRESVVCIITVPILCLDTAAARLSSSPKAPKHFFREMSIGSVDVCDVLYLKVQLRFGVLCCDRAAVFGGGRVRHSTCVVLWYSSLSMSRGLIH